MKKKIIIILVTLGIIFVFIGYRAYIGYSIFKLVMAKDFYSKYEEYSRCDTVTKKNDDNNFPDYLKSFYAYDYIKENRKEFIKLENLTPLVQYSNKEKVKLYDSEANKRLVIEAEAMFGKNVDNFKNIVPIIENKMKEKKKNIPPTFKESESFPTSPSFSAFYTTVDYWYIISRLLETKKDYETSLYLSLAPLYLSRDIRANYNCSSSFFANLKGVTDNRKACDSIFVWASKPRPECKELSKVIAKDILDLVKNDYPFSKVIEYDYNMFNGLLKFFEAKVSTIYSIFPNSLECNKVLNVFYKKPMTFYDKPLYEIKKEIKYTYDYYVKMMTDTKNSNLIYYACLNPEMLLCIRLIHLYCPYFEKQKQQYEASLAKMEMAAIALAINSYVCENNKCPESMEELSKWFGSELPKNRLTNEPYVLDFKGEHVLYNDNYYEFCDKGLISKKKDDFYFDFSM